MISLVAQVHLLVRGLGPLSFRRGGLASGGGALSYTLGRLFYKGCLRFFPRNTALVFRRVFAPTATAMRLLPRGRAPTGEVEATKCDTPVRVPAVTLRVSEALAALALNWNFGATYVYTDTRSPQGSLIERTLDTSGPRTTDRIK